MIQSIFFIGMSKNCFATLEKNVDFLLEFKKISKFKVDICIVDSDSTDGTKEYCYNLAKTNTIDSIVEVDNLENEFSSRIERLSISRNKGLDYIKDNLENSCLYIPMDMDLNLFSLLDCVRFEKIVEDFIDSEADGLFPYSKPYYYDIFALRKQDWVSGNNLLTSKNLKKRFRVMSFLFNYFLIFKKQRHIDTFSKNYIEVESAFGGMGIYKIQSNTLVNARYDINQTEVNFYSEHIFFNSSFNNLFISTKWNIESPIEYTFFNSFSYIEKIIYILKTLKNDIKHLNMGTDNK